MAQLEQYTAPPASAGAEGLQAPVKHDVQPLTPEQRCDTQPASQNMAVVDVNHTPQSITGAA